MNKTNYRTKKIIQPCFPLCKFGFNKIKKGKYFFQNEKRHSNISNKVFGSSYAEEKAMLRTFAKIGFKIAKIKHSLITLDIDGEKKIFQMIGLNKYTKERNRMSILIRNEKDPGSILLCKANDLTIFSLIKKSNPQIDNEVTKSKLQIKELSKYGYRPFIFIIIY